MAPHPRDSVAGGVIESCSVGVPLDQRYVQIRHRPTGAVIAGGPLGFGIMPFEGNYYIRRRYLREGHFRADYLPGVCVYKGLYIGLNYIAPDRTVSHHLGWLYWLPNPLLPFIMFRVAIPAEHPLLKVESFDEHAACRNRQSDRASAVDRSMPAGTIPADEANRHAA